MDPEVSVLLDCADWRGLLESQVQVELSERFNRQTDADLERHIEDVWKERVSKEPWLFNGAKFRLHSFCLASPRCPSSSFAASKHPPCNQSSQEPYSTVSVDNQGDLDPQRYAQDGLDCRNIAAPLLFGKNTPGPDTGPLLTLRLGLTCYRDYLGTNWSCRVAELCQRGEAEFNDPLALLAQPLGVGGILCTQDGQVVLIRRSQRVAEAGGLLDIPGGPQSLSMAKMQQRREAIVSELFRSVCAEIRDEVNLPLSCLGEPVLMGVALNHTSAGRASAEFYRVVLERRSGGHESTDIVFLSRAEMLQLDRSSTLWSELCPSAKGAVLLYQTVKPDAEPEWSRRPDAQLITSKTDQTEFLIREEKPPPLSA
ncbi:hypothetical protein INR49_023124 [Caranx melampygus]|nr:hypothetical protein INR49_023124 [Caranx melampygus]